MHLFPIHPALKAVGLALFVMLLAVTRCYASDVASKDGRSNHRAQVIDDFMERGDWQQVDEILLSRDGKPPPNGKRCVWALLAGGGKRCSGGCSGPKGCWSDPVGGAGTCANCDMHGKDCQRCNSKCWPYTGKCQKDKPWDE